MDIYTSIMPGWENETIWEQPDVQQILGPARARIDVLSPIEGWTPLPLRILVALDNHRYVVTHLEVHANQWSDANDVMAPAHRSPTDEVLFTPSTRTPTISSSALSAIRLPPILTRALQQEMRVRRRLSTGEWVTGMSETDLVPATYMLAQATGADPTVAVAERLGISRTAAAQRVARARKPGRDGRPASLPPTTQGAR